MPLYEYECPKCGEFEVEQRITEDALKKCPKCRRKVRKLISLTSFQLKGEGWYITDYARKSKGEQKKESKAASESKSAGSESKGSESKSSKTSSGETKNKAA